MYWNYILISIYDFSISVKVSLILIIRGDSLETAICFVRKSQRETIRTIMHITF